jgi:hypothetical protein
MIHFYCFYKSLIKKNLILNVPIIDQSNLKVINNKFKESYSDFQEDEELSVHIITNIQFISFTDI